MNKRSLKVKAVAVFACLVFLVALLYAGPSILSVYQGGTGASSFTAHGVLIGEGSSAIAATAAGTSGQCLISNGSSADPTYQTCAASAHGIATALSCADASGSGTAQTCTTSPTFTPAAKDCINYTPGTTNTGALTLNVNSSSAAPVQKWLGTALASGDMVSGKTVTACYDGTNWQVMTIGNAPSGGGGTTTWICDPTNYVCMYDDFLSFNPASSDGTIFSTGQLSWRLGLSGGGGTSFAIDSGAYGSIHLNTGSSSGNGDEINVSGTGTPGDVPYNATTFDARIRFALQQTTSISVLLGFDDHTTIGEQHSNYIGIAYDTSQSDTGFKCAVKKSGSATRSSVSGTVDTNYHTARIRSTSAGTILCSIDGGTETSVNTNVPTANLVPGLSVRTQTSGIRSLNLDYFWHWYAISR